MRESNFFSAFAPFSASFRLSVDYNAPLNSPLALLRAASCGTLSKASGFPHTFHAEAGSKQEQNSTKAIHRTRVKYHRTSDYHRSTLDIQSKSPTGAAAAETTTAEASKASRRAP